MSAQQLYTTPSVAPHTNTMLKETFPATTESRIAIEDLDTNLQIKWIPSPAISGRLASLIR